MNHLIVADSLIHQDVDGRYCLNDLHRAAVYAGANGRTKEPAKFFASQQTADLVKDLTDTQNLGIAPVNAIKGGKNQGTYVCKELVYAYAMWISPKFHLQVIRAYDAMVTAAPAPARNDQIIEQVLLRVDRLCGVVEKLIEALPAIIAAQRPRVRRPAIYEKDIPAILALRQQGATLPDIARATGFGQTSLYYVLEGKFTIAPGGRIKRVADTDKVSAIVRQEGETDGQILLVPAELLKQKH